MSELLLLLAGVSLVIGAFGIANTATISVMERPAEIGLRRALGAQRRTLAAQFLAEAVVLGALVGALAGLYPARRAAAVEPVVALRS